MDASFREKTWPHGPQQGRHGSFFDWKGQSYFMYCDMSFSGNRYYRGSWISYIHYRENGEIAPIEITTDAVGRYSADKTISAANFTQATGIQKMENPDGSFSIQPVEQESSVSYPNVMGLEGKSVTVTLHFCKITTETIIQVSNGKTGKKQEAVITFKNASFHFERFNAQAGITIRFKDTSNKSLRMNYLTISST